LFFLVWLGVVVWCASASAGVLVFQRPGAGANAVIVVARSTDGGAPRVIGRGSAPVVSPDGRQVAFLQPRAACPRALFADAGCQRLLVADIATGAIQQFAPYAEAPIAWSADSRYLASQDSNQDNLNTQVISLRSRRRDVFATGVGGGFGIVESIAFSLDDSRVLSCATEGRSTSRSRRPAAVESARTVRAVNAGRRGVATAWRTPRRTATGTTRPAIPTFSFALAPAAANGPFIGSARTATYRSRDGQPSACCSRPQVMPAGSTRS